VDNKKIQIKFVAGVCWTCTPDVALVVLRWLLAPYLIGNVDELALDEQHQSDNSELAWQLKLSWNQNAKD
jgi:hypothetical protein